MSLLGCSMKVSPIRPHAKADLDLPVSPILPHTESLRSLDEKKKDIPRQRQSANKAETRLIQQPSGEKSLSGCYSGTDGCPDLVGTSRGENLYRVHTGQKLTESEMCAFDGCCLESPVGNLCMVHDLEDLPRQIEEQKVNDTITSQRLNRCRTRGCRYWEEVAGADYCRVHQGQIERTA